MLFHTIADINSAITINIESHNYPSLIYYGVGTAAGIRNTDGLLEKENYHQFPPLLQHIKNKFYDLTIHLVL